MRVLVIEDEPTISGAIREGLEEEGFQVEAALDGRAGLVRAQADLFGLIILDVMLPGLNGWQVCRRLREEGNATPVLMLTACSTPDERVLGLDMGADDYLPKPFHFPELLARVRALLRRDKLYRGRTLHVADLEIDTRARAVRRAGRPIFLTPRQYSLLESLAAREGQTLTRTGDPGAHLDGRPEPGKLLQHGGRTYRPAPKEDRPRLPGQAHPDRARDRVHAPAPPNRSVEVKSSFALSSVRTRLTLWNAAVVTLIPARRRPRASLRHAGRPFGLAGPRSGAEGGSVPDEARPASLPARSGPAPAAPATG